MLTGLVGFTDGVVSMSETIVGAGLFVLVPDLVSQGESGAVLGACLLESTGDKKGFA